MSKVRKIIELYHEKRGKKTIAKRLNLPLRTVRRYIWLYLASSKEFSELMQLDDQSLENLFIQMSNRSQLETNQRYEQLQVLFPTMEKELKKVGVTKETLWKDYLQKYPDGYKKTQFNLYYSKWLKSRYPNAVMQHKAGAKMYVDYTGKKLKIVDESDGKIVELEVFVAILGASQLIYVEASRSQSTQDFIASNVKALEYFGGSPEAIVTDNLKAAVIKSSKYEPTLNDAFKSFAAHYTMAILPAAPYRPTYKALVEGAVKIIYREIFVELEKQIFSSIETLNRAIYLLLDRLNGRKFSHKDYSRRELFNEIEAAELNELPSKPYQIKNRTYATVLKNNHVRFAADQHYYSVPYQFIGKKVAIYFDENQIDIYYRYERIAIHQRDRTLQAYSTFDEHLLAKNRGLNNHDTEKYLEKAKEIGPEAYDYMQKIIEQSPHPEAGIKSCRGLISLQKGFSAERINKACRRAASYQDYSYRTIEEILKKGLDQQQDDEDKKKDLPKHNNVRGKDYFNQ